MTKHNAVITVFRRSLSTENAVTTTLVDTLEVWLDDKLDPVMFSNLPDMITDRALGLCILDKELDLSNCYFIIGSSPTKYEILRIMTYRRPTKASFAIGPYHHTEFIYG